MIIPKFQIYLIFNVVVIYITNYAEKSLKMIINGYNNYLDESDNNNDGHDFLRNLFFFIELDRDSINIDLNFNFESKEFYKRFIENAVPIIERLKIDNSANKNLVFFKFFIRQILTNCRYIDYFEK
jgi:hypothetical protein